MTRSTRKSFRLRENNASECRTAVGRFDLAKCARKNDWDAIHDAVQEMARDEARHSEAFEGLLKRYFG